MSFKIGIIKEGKNPPDKRVAFTPEQCRVLMETYPDLEIIVEPSAVRCFTDEQYIKQGVKVDAKMNECDVLMGIKEVPVDQLIPNKKYFFFSHTIKKQAHNQKLIAALLEKNITMVDYETLCYKEGGRIIGFGRYAGIVGTYNAMRLYAEKYQQTKIKPAHECYDRKELEEELKKVQLSKNYKIIVTGAGRVGGGCLEILKFMNIRQVSAQDFLTRNFDEPVFTQLHVDDYNLSKDGAPFDRDLFYHDPANFTCDFLKYTLVGDMYIPCHFWDNRSPKILTPEDYRHPKFNVKIIADISCDIAEPIASTLRASTIESPFYGYDKTTGKEVDFMQSDCVAVMAVDNLPCELPRNASEDFGKTLKKEIIPALLSSDSDKIIERATICTNGKLTQKFSYLEDYAYAKVSK